jgi:DNA repair protein RadC
MTAAVPHYHGHRQRLRERFRQGTWESLPEYELLELFLFRVIPRRDTKPLAKKLIATFGSFTDVFQADAARLSEVPGVGTAIIAEFKLVREVVAALTAPTPSRLRPRLACWSEVLQHLRAEARPDGLRALFLDNRNRILTEEFWQGFDASFGVPSASQILRRALEVSASSLIVVQHREAAKPTLATADVVLARELISGCGPLGVDMHDYLLVGTAEHYSLRAMGDV